MKPEAINSYMRVSRNGTGTAYCDLRPASFEFLKSKDRRDREPTAEIYRKNLFKCYFWVTLIVFDETFFLAFSTYQALFWILWSYKCGLINGLILLVGLNGFARWDGNHLEKQHYSQMSYLPSIDAYLIDFFILD